MPSYFIAAFVVFDLVVTFMIFSYVVRKRGGIQGLIGVDLSKISKIAREMEGEVASQLPPSVSGDPGSLAGPLHELLDRFEQKVGEAQMPVDRATLQWMLAGIVSAKGIASREQVMEAFKLAA